MSIENGPKPEGAAEWKAPVERKINDDINNVFNSHKGYADTIIEDGDLMSEEEKLEIFEAIKPMPTFEEYVKSQRGSDEEPVLREAEVELAKVFNEIVARFNEDLPRIKKDQDAQAILDYCEQLAAISKGQ